MQGIAQFAQRVGLDTEFSCGFKHQAQARFHVGQPLGVKVDTADIVVQVGHGFADGDAGGLQFVVHPLQAGVVPQHLVNAVIGGGDAVVRGIAFAIQPFQDLRGAVQQRLGMRQARVLGLQGVPFVRPQRQLVKLINLPLQAVAFVRQAGGVFFGGFQLACQRTPLLPGLAHGLAQIAMAAVGVKQIALGVGAHQALMGVLAVDVDQAVAQLA
ncbi:hypothetical protein D3C87_1364910 [compost metagenome]